MRRLAIVNLLLFLCLLCGDGNFLAAQEDDLILLSLPQTQTVTEAVVHIRDIAELKGGSAAVRNHIRNLDIAELLEHKPQAIYRQEILYRLQLAGLDVGHVQVIGPSHALVTLLPQRLTEEWVVTAARQYVLKRLPPSAEEITIRLAQPLDLPRLDIKAKDQVRLVVEGRTPTTAGRNRLDVLVFLNGQRRTLIPVFLDIVHTLQVAVARRRIQAGEVLKEEMVNTERKMADSKEMLLTEEECVGKKVQRALRLGQHITEADVDLVVEEPLLVKSREMVRLEVRLGNLRVLTAGEAMQDGRLGQIIRVRNVDSNKTVSGRVVERGLVEVEY